MGVATGQSALSIAGLALTAGVSGIVGGFFGVALCALNLYIFLIFTIPIRGGLLMWFNGWGHPRAVVRASCVLNIAMGAVALLVCLGAAVSGELIAWVIAPFGLTYLASAVVARKVVYRLLRDQPWFA